MDDWHYRQYLLHSLTLQPIKLVFSPQILYTGFCYSSAEALWLYHDNACLGRH